MFINDLEKMKQMIKLEKNDFLEKFSGITEKEYNSTMEEIKEVILNRTIEDIKESIQIYEDFTLLSAAISGEGFKQIKDMSDKELLIQFRELDN